MPIGAFAHIGVAKETVWGTPVAAADYIPFISENIVHEQEQIADESLKAILDENPALRGLETVQGDLVCEARPTSLGYLLHSALGEPTVSGTGPYVHTFKPRTSKFSADCFLRPYTLEIFRDTEQAFQIAGAIINTLQLQLGAGNQKILRATAGIMAKAVTQIAETSPSFETLEPFTWDEAIIKIADNVAGLTGASADTTIEVFNINIDNKIEGIPLLNGSTKMGKMKPSARRTVGLELTMEALDSDYAKFTGRTYKAMRITLTQSASAILQLTMPKVEYIGYPVGVAGPGRITVAVAGRAWYDAAESYAIEAVLTNSKTSYTA